MITPEHLAGAFERHRARVEAAAMRLIGDRDEARDIASEAYLALLERGPSDPDAALPWLLTAARNRAINRLRDRGNEQRKAARLAGDAVDHNPEVGDDAAADLIHRAMAGLSERDRLAVRLRYLEDAGFDRIAESLGVSRAQARVVVHRAGRRLRAATVDLLAVHHRAGEECRQRLVEKLTAHAGCGPCAAVADEIGALGALGVVPLPLAIAPRILGRLPQRLPSSGGRTSEAIAALIVAGGMALSGSSPAVVGAHTPNAMAAPPAAIETTTPAVRTAPVPPAPKPKPRIKTVRALPDPGRDTVSIRDHSLVRALGIPRVIPDVEEPELERGIDVRSLSIATLGGTSGRSEAMLFRFTLAGPVPNGAMYFIDLKFRDKRCGGDIGSFHPHDGGEPQVRAAIYCEQDWLLPDAQQELLDIDMRRPSPNIIEYEVRFSDRNEITRKMRGGEWLHLTVHTSYNTGIDDWVPDVRGFNYRIEP